MKYQELERAFPGKRFTKIINCTKENPLTFTEMVVYSCLIQRASHGKGADQKQISRAVRLNSSTSVPGALAVLERHQLVAKRGKRWVAVQPSGNKVEWFRECRGSGDQAWYRRLSYWWMGLPAKLKRKQLTLKQMAVYFKLLNLQGSCREQSQQGLSRLLRIDRKTVRTALGKLQQVGLVDGDLDPNLPTADQLNWFRNKPEQKQFKVSEELSLSRSSREAEMYWDMLDSFGPMMIDASYSERQIVDFFQLALNKSMKNAKVFVGFLAEFREMFKKVESDHQRNKASGKYTKARNSLGLLKVEAKQRINRLIQRMQ